MDNAIWHTLALSHRVHRRAMIFASHFFLSTFLPLFLLAYYLAPRRLRSLVIALSSYVFYGWWRPDFVLLMLISTVVDFYCGGRIVQARLGGGSGRGFLWLSVVTNLGLLAYFKYANFAVDTLNGLRAYAGAEPWPWMEVVLPVGISFYTFQSLSYTVDLYRGKGPPVQGFTDFMCYVAMFPQLIAGPIVRYHTFAEQLRERRHDLPTFTRGIVAFQIGLVKKVLIADSLASIPAIAFTEGVRGPFEAWLGILVFGFQIYFDFSGYSDMAIGLGLMIGFRLPVNFARPYAAVSITDHWRRWHISLSAFLRDYLYVPLGGNRKGAWRTQFNLAATMLLGGLWHGAQWTFVIWGAYHGLWLALERWLGKRSPVAALPKALQIAFTYLIVHLSWVLFCSPSLSYAARYAATLVGASGFEGAPWILVTPLQAVVLVAAVIVVWTQPTTQERLETLRPSFLWPLQALFILTLLQLYYLGHVPFLYYQF